VTRPSAYPDRRGIALPLALFTLVIAAVMITAVFYVGRLEQRMGNNSVAAVQAFQAAETGVATVLTGWIPSTYNSLADDSTITLPTTAVGSNATYDASVRRLNSTLFLVRAEGRYLVAGLAVTRRQVARVVRLDPPTIDPEAPLVTRLGLTVTGNAVVNGRDSVPTSWTSTCPPPGLTAPDIVDSAGSVDTTGLLTGILNIQTNSALANSGTFDNFGSMTFASLSAAAEKVVGGTLGSLGPTTDAGSPPSCRIGDLQNWGDPLDPTGPCGNYFPVIYAPNDLTLSGGWGQGVLLVDGNLILSGGVQFYGIIVVRGAVTTSGGQVIGALMTDNEFGLSALVGGTTELYYSRCAIDRAVTGAAQPSAVRERNWVQLY
jgi:hypothetical protein